MKFIPCTPFTLLLVSGLVKYAHASAVSTRTGLRGSAEGTDVNAEDSRVVDTMGVEKPPRRDLLGTVTCRITIESTQLVDGTDEDVTLCIPIKGGTELDRSLPIDLPENITSGNELVINEGRLVIQLSNAKLSKAGVIASDNTIYSILSVEVASLYYDDPDEHGRLLGGDRRLDTTGSRTLAVVRVSTADSANSYSQTQLVSAWVGSSNSFKTQMSQCSFGALQFSSGGYYNVKLPNNLSYYKTRDDMQTAIETKLRSMVNKDLKYVANHIVFCYPKGSPGNFMASGTMNYWRSVYYDSWCMSLSAGMHEVGHNFGLLHSTLGNDEYGDTSGMMGYSAPGLGSPLKCYNPHKNWLLGWYSKNRVSISGSRTIRLVAFPDYNKAASTDVVVAKVGSVYIQYNRAKSFNSQTDVNVNEVSVTGVLSNGKSISLAGLGVGDTYTSGGTVIKVCSSMSGGSTGPDAMVVAIGGGC